jgi:AraC-like DNA-binding protein
VLRAPGAFPGVVAAVVPVVPVALVKTEPPPRRGVPRYHRGEFVTTKWRRGMVGAVREVRGETRDLGTWRSIVNGPQPPWWWLHVDAPDDGFTGRLTRVISEDFGLDITDTSSEYHTVHRVDQRIETVGDPYYVVRYQLTGRTRLRHGERVVDIPEGGFACSWLDEPYSWEFVGPSTQAIFYLSKATLGPNAPLLPSESGQLIGAAHPLHRHLTSFARSLVDHHDVLRAPAGAGAMGSLASLVAAGVARGAAAAEPSPAEAMYERITEYLYDRLASPELSLSSVAAANFVSKRTVQALFHEHGTTFSEWLRHRRLTKVRRDLVNPAYARLTVREIGERWGITDQAYLSRVFRNVYDESPSQWRRRADGTAHPLLLGRPG